MGIFRDVVGQGFSFGFSPSDRKQANIHESPAFQGSEAIKDASRQVIGDLGVRGKVLLNLWLFVRLPIAHSYTLLVW